MTFLLLLPAAAAMFVLGVSDAAVALILVAILAAQSAIKKAGRYDHS